VQDGRPGIPQNEANRARDVEIGRVLFNPSSDLPTEGRAFRTLLQLGAGGSELVSRLLTLRRPAWRLASDAQSGAAALASTYAQTAELVEALSHRYGFEALYAWQLTLMTTQKRLTPYDKTLAAQIENDEFQRRLKEVHLAAMQQVAPNRFVDLAGLFAGDTVAVFVDPIGHTTEAANGPIARAIMAHLVRLLRRPMPNRFEPLSDLLRPRQVTSPSPSLPLLATANRRGTRSHREPHGTSAK